MKQHKLIIVLTCCCILFLAWDIVTEFPEKGVLRSAVQTLYVFLLTFLSIWHLRNERKIVTVSGVMTASRISKMAIASLIMAILTELAWIGITVESGSPKTWITGTSGTAMFAGPIAGFILAYLALVRIRRSQGRLRGTSIAIVGLLAAAILIALLVLAGHHAQITTLK